MRPLMLGLMMLALIDGGIGLAQSPPAAKQASSSLREKLVELRIPTPIPELPPTPETPSERYGYFKKTEPLWTAYWQKERPRLMALAQTCEEVLTDDPNATDAAALEAEMAEAYVRVVGTSDAEQKKAHARIDAWLERPNLRADTAKIFYGFQINMIAIISGGEMLDEIASVTRDSKLIPDHIRQALDKFAVRYPATPALGALSLSAANYLEPNHSFARGETAKLREEWLEQAERFGDEDTRKEVATIRFRQAAVGHAAPPVIFVALDGRQVDLASLKGKVAVLDFWAPWCGPCVQQMPKVKELYARDHSRGLEIIGISLDSERGKVEGFVQRQGIPWPQYFDGKGWGNSLAEQFGVRGIPETWVIDSNGNVAAIGPDDLAAVVETQLAKAVTLTGVEGQKPAQVSP